VLGKRTLTDIPTVLIALTTAAILFKFKKLQEPFVILAAAIGLALKLLTKLNVYSESA
jgi:chromate transporter